MQSLRLNIDYDRGHPESYRGTFLSRADGLELVRFMSGDPVADRASCFDWTRDYDLVVSEGESVGFFRSDLNFIAAASNAAASPVRKATDTLFNRYLGILAEAGEDPLASHPRLALANLGWMSERALEQEFPIDKASRWLGFVQGCLAMRGLVDVDAERDFSRPLFHAAYEEMGMHIPEKAERERDQDQSHDFSKF